MPDVLLMVLTVLVYLPCLQGPRLWDDTEWFNAMDQIARSWRGLWQIWSLPGTIQQYYPLTGTTFWLDARLWGQWMLPAHLENVLLHGASAVLFWRLLKRLHVPGAWIAAALFAVHPVMVESVAWVTERKNVLCTFFSLLALLVHGRVAGWWEAGTADRKRWLEVLPTLLVALALLSKISAALLPGVVLVIGWWRAGAVRWRADGLRVLPWILVALPLMRLTSQMEGTIVQGSEAMQPLSVADRLLLAGQLPWFYAWKLVVPLNLCVLYERWSLAGWQWTGAAALLALLGVLVWRRWHGALALVLIFLGTLVPVLGFFDVNGMKYAWAADRWAYLSAMAFFTGAGVLLARLRSLKITTVLMLAISFLTARQAELYSSVDTFWQAAIAGSRTPWKAHNDYGSQLMDAKRCVEAREHFEASLKLKPDSASALVNLGTALDQLGSKEQALDCFDQAITLQPEHNSVVHYDKAVVLESMGRTADAEASLRAAIAIKPDFYAAYNDLGNLLLLSGRHDDAMVSFEKLLELRPGNANALTSIGNIHFLRGETAKALDYFTASLRQDSSMVSTLANTAWIMATTADEKLRNGTEAVRHASRAVELSRREDPSVMQALAAACAEAGDFGKAVATCAEAARLARARGNQNLAASLEAMQRQFEQQQPYRVPARS